MAAQEDTDLAFPDCSSKPASEAPQAATVAPGRLQCAFAGPAILAQESDAERFAAALGTMPPCRAPILAKPRTQSFLRHDGSQTGIGLSANSVRTGVLGAGEE